MQWSSTRVALVTPSDIIADHVSYARIEPEIFPTSTTGLTFALASCVTPLSFNKTSRPSRAD
jgi:hypothetical protein